MKFFLLVFFISTLYGNDVSSFKKPNLLLLKNYTSDENVTGWYMSEKLDGVRGFWDGEKLISRNGKIFKAPLFFTKDFPKTELDGEIWSKRGDFSRISSIVNTKLTKKGWKELTYNVFEVPNAVGTLKERLSRVKDSKYIRIIKQIKVKDKKHLDAFLKSVEKKAGEGVVVRDGSLEYYTGRTNRALKVKSYIDEECKVIGYNEGTGKYRNMLGSVNCKMGNNQILKIGTGFKNHQRTDPPEIGAIITFKYYGLTSKGNPRFPVFLRIR